jgi:hypothetical protein
MQVDESNEPTVEEDLAARQLLARYSHALDDVDLHPALDATQFFDEGAELVIGDTAFRGTEIGPFLASLTPGGMHAVTNIALTKDPATGQLHCLSHFIFLQKAEASWQLVAAGSYADVLVLHAGRARFLRREVRM